MFLLPGPTNWGYTFHTAFALTSRPNNTLTLQILTPGLGTDVRIEGYLENTEINQIVKVTRNTAVS